MKLFFSLAFTGLFSLALLPTSLAFFSPADPDSSLHEIRHLPTAPLGSVQVSSQVGGTTDDVLEDKVDGSQYVFTSQKLF